LQDIDGSNLHGIKYIIQRHEEKEGIRLFMDATKNSENKNKARRKKERDIKRAIMNL